jgi:hypothetical protein
VAGKAAALSFYNDVRALVKQVMDAMEQGVSRERIIEEIRFEDLLHPTTDMYIGYPEAMMEEFQRRSMGAIYDQVLEKWGGPRAVERTY